VRPRILSLRLAYVAYFASLGVYAPFFPRWLEARGVTGVSLGVVSSALPAMGVVGPPFFGWLADRLRLRGKLLRLSLAGAALVFAALAPLAAAGPRGIFAPLLGLMLLFALVRSPIVTLLDVVTLEHAEALGSSFGGIRLWGSVGFLVAAAGAGVVVDPSSPVALPLLVAGGLALAAAITFTLPGAAHTPKPPRLSDVRTLLARRDYQLACLAMLFAQLGHSAYDLTYSLHPRDLGFSDAFVGSAWALGVLAEIGLMALTPRLFAGGKQPRYFALGLVGAVVRWGLLGQATSPGAVLALQPLHALSFALTWMGGATWVKDAVRGHLLATAQGVFLGAFALGSLGGMLVWSALYRSHGGAFVFSAAAGVSFVALGVAALFVRVAERPRLTSAP
jgi:PPP family 3-phenylpropionic acid transporter